jgi:serine/threonine-protein kinase
MLTVGSSLGPYEITGPLGAGGMGIVFRARDTRLKRDVAVKVLPEGFSADRDRVARFQREAELLAALTHQNIAAVYGIEESGHVRALVMELVEGETLSQRIARGPIPVAEALTFARQLAEALDYAHEHGILHRDLKPHNIKITGDGRLKVLDFGLAKLAQAPDSGLQASGEFTQSPTITSPAFTQAGMLLGTAAYMSPEQARGRTVDKRADIWAFGCVLFEMLAGRRAFDGETVADVLAAVMTRDPDMAALPSSAPNEIVALIRHSLQKDNRRRLRDIGDAVAVFDTTPATVSHKATDRAPSGIMRAFPWAVSAVALIAAVAAILIAARRPAVTPTRVVRVQASAGGDMSLVTDTGPTAVLSPDGSSLAFTARRLGQVRQLYIRRLDQLEATLLSGTEDARVPFFSPDSQWIAFFAGGKLKKVPAAGGPVVVLCDAPSGRGGTWGEDGFIVFTPNSSDSVTLLKVNVNGGEPTAFTTLREGETTQRWPQVLPRGRGVLYSTSRILGDFNNGDIIVKPPDGEAKVVLHGGYFGRYLRSGHLTYIHDGRLFAVPFDLDRLETVGTAVPVLERLVRAVNTGAAQFDASENGTAVYISDEPGATQPLQWLARDGAITQLAAAPADWSNPRLSPDGQRLAIDRFDGRQTDVYVYDWERNVMTQLTFDPGEDWLPVWTPDGGRVMFRSTQQRFAFNLHWQPSDGVQQSETLTDSRNPLTPASWHPNGDLVAYVEANPTTNNDIMLLPLSQKGGAPTGPPKAFLNTAAQEITPAFSPDGRWIAYVSNELGRNGVYVRPYPGPGGQWLVAPEGTDPTWSRARRELVYLGPDQRLMVATYRVTGDSFRTESTRPWASARAIARTRGLVGFDGRAFDLHPDGNRAIGAWAPESAPLPVQNTVILAFNFFDELRRLAPTTQ